MAEEQREYTIEEYNTTEHATVMAREIKLKGYSKAKFIAFKDPDSNFWFIHDMVHGKCVQEDTQVTTLPKAKQSAREYLEKHTGKDQRILLAKLVEFPVLNAVQQSG